METAGDTDNRLDLVVVDPVGGLGNTLFTVSAGYALARRHNADFAIRRLDYVPGHCSEISPHFPHGWPVYWDTVYRSFRVEAFDDWESLTDVSYWEPQTFVDLDDQIPESARRIRLSGYLQNTRYFDSFKREIASRVSEPPDDVREYLEDKYAPSSTRLLIIGLRQSRDYQENGWTLPLAYYANAYRYFQERAKADTYRVIAIADENDWAREHLRPLIPDLVIADERDNPLGHHMSVLQYYLMLRGQAFILSNSTFHWWGAYLADSELILSPREHHNPYRVTMPKPDVYHEIGEDLAARAIWQRPTLRVRQRD